MTQPTTTIYPRPFHYPSPTVWATPLTEDLEKARLALAMRGGGGYCLAEWWHYLPTWWMYRA